MDCGLAPAVRARTARRTVVLLLEVGAASGADAGGDVVVVLEGYVAVLEDQKTGQVVPNVGEALTCFDYTLTSPYPAAQEGLSEALEQKTNETYTTHRGNPCTARALRATFRLCSP